MNWRIIQGDCRAAMETLEPESVHTCVTSPPYWGLRDYGTGKWEGGSAECDHKGPPLASSSSSLAGYTSEDVKVRTHTVPMRGECTKCGAVRIDGQLGLEPTPAEYVAAMVETFRAVRRVLRDDGTLWLNLGDSYASGGEVGRHDAREKLGVGATSKFFGTERQYTNRDHGLKPKDLVGIPWRVAFALQADGWYLRQDIIWAKPNPMPESVRDRCTKSHEYLFLLAKSERYYYDAEAIAEALQGEPHSPGNKKLDNSRNDHDQMKKIWGESGLRNRRSVWTIPTHPFPEAHFATFPEKLVEPCILAGSPEGGTVLDPFSGAGTTGVVAIKASRNYVGCELNPEYVAMSRKRIGGVSPMFAKEITA